MKKQKAIKTLHQNFVFYIMGLLIIFYMKYCYSHAGAPKLRWLLAPTSGWVSLLSRIEFVYIPEAGYVNHDLKMLIAPSCSGIQFMLITTAMLLFSFIHRTGQVAPWQNQQIRTTQNPRIFPKKIAWFCFSFLFSYLYTILINGLRIITALYLPRFLDRQGSANTFLSPAQLHTSIGTVLYFMALLVLYQGVGYLFHRGEELTFLRKCLSPVFWYFSIVLGLPFLNRAYEKNGEQFTAFAFLVAGCCAAVLLLYCLIFFAGRFWKKYASFLKNIPRIRHKSP